MVFNVTCNVTLKRHVNNIMVKECQSHDNKQLIYKLMVNKRRSLPYCTVISCGFRRSVLSSSSLSEAPAFGRSLSFPSRTGATAAFSPSVCDKARFLGLLYVFSMFANGFLRFTPPRDRPGAFNSGPGENGRTPGTDTTGLEVLRSGPSLRARFRLIRRTSHGFLKLGE